jgi:hypothetical protein
VAAVGAAGGAGGWKGAGGGENRGTTHAGPPGVVRLARASFRRRPCVEALRLPCRTRTERGERRAVMNHGHTVERCAYTRNRGGPVRLFQAPRARAAADGAATRPRVPNCRCDSDRLECGVL